MSGIQGIGSSASQPTLFDPQVGISQLVSATPSQTTSQTGATHHHHHGNKAQMDAAFQNALTSVTGSSDKSSQVQQQIQSAVASALQGGGGKDAVKSAVDTVLTQNGIDPAKFQAALQQNREANAGHDGDADDAGASNSPANPASIQTWTGASPVANMPLPRFNSQA